MTQQIDPREDISEVQSGLLAQQHLSRMDAIDAMLEKPIKANLALVELLVPRDVLLVEIAIGDSSDMIYLRGAVTLNFNLNNSASFIDGVGATHLPSGNMVGHIADTIVAIPKQNICYMTILPYDDNSQIVQIRDEFLKSELA